MVVDVCQDVFQSCFSLVFVRLCILLSNSLEGTTFIWFSCRLLHVNFIQITPVKINSIFLKLECFFFPNCNERFTPNECH